MRAFPEAMSWEGWVWGGAKGQCRLDPHHTHCCNEFCLVSTPSKATAESPHHPPYSPEALPPTAVMSSAQPLHPTKGAQGLGVRG